MRHYGLLVFTLVFALAFVMMPLSVSAQNPFVTPKVGTQGAGADLGYRLSPKWVVRGNANYFTYSHDDTIKDVDYDADPTLTTIGALLDFHPFENGFRISGGAYYNGNEMDLNARLSKKVSYKIGDHTYTKEEMGSLDGKVEYNSFAPYFGIGWGTSTSSGNWAFSMDLGGMYHGSPDVDLSAKNQEKFDELGGPDRDLNKDIERERQKIENEMDYSIYPVVSVGVTYRF